MTCFTIRPTTGEVVEGQYLGYAPFGLHLCFRSDSGVWKLRTLSVKAALKGR